MNLSLVSIHIDHSLRAVPLGTAMLAAAVKDAFGPQIVTSLVDCTLQQSAADCTEQILSHRPAAVGLSISVWNRDLALQIARNLKAACPQLVLFAGGPEVTADCHGLAAMDDLDFVLPGEGEKSLVGALHNLLQGRPPTEGQACCGAAIENLAELPSPYLDGTLQPAPGGSVLWELSRGCPYGCDFCFESRGSAVVRRFPLARVRAELELFAARGVAEVFVLDPTFNYHKETAKELLQIMAEVGEGLHFSMEIRAELVDEELAELFAAVDCSLQIGLQSADPAVLQRINRSLDRDEFSAKVLLLHQAGVSYGFDLIYGLPGDSLEGFLASVDFALSLVPNHLDTFPLAVLPGTRLAETAAGLGLDYQRHAPYRVLSAATFSSADMNQAARIAAACDLFYNRGRAVPWFAMVLDALELAPSEFFARFADYMPEPLPADTVPLQQQFVAELFGRRQQPEIAGLAADLIAYFGYVEPLRDGSPTAAPPLAATQALVRNPCSRFVTFHHDPQVLLQHLDCGITDLEELAFFVPAVDGEYFCHQFRNALHMHPVTADQSAFLKSFDQGAPPHPEPPGFAARALAEGMLYRKS